MMSFKIDKIWPLRIDLSDIECREILREKELVCYRDVVSVLRAQGPPNDEKKAVLINIQKLFSISEERHRSELRRAANNEKLATISESISGFDGYAEWAALGALKIPPTQRPIPRTIFNDESTQTIIDYLVKEKMFPLPMETNDLESTKKHEEAIRLNRLSKINQIPILTSSTATNTDPIKPLLKAITSKDGSTSLDYNLHLLSEIAAGESNQSVNALDSSDSDIKPDNFSIHHQIDDIELSLIVPEIPFTSQSRHLSANNSVITPCSTNVVKNLSNSVKHISSISNDSNVINISIANSVPVVLGNSNVNQSINQRIVIPLNTISTHNVSHFTNNQQKHHMSNLIPSKQMQPTTYYTLPNNTIRSPPSNQMGYSWTSQAPHGQQVFIQNASSHHGLNSGQSNVSHQNIDNIPPFGYVLQKRPSKIEQNQNNKQTLVVRDLGSQPSMDPERNKRFMVVKGGNTTGPSTKKPKISNPSNRQPGRPPLMPAPMPAYKPYVANDSCVINRTSINATSSVIDSPATDSNGLKICSISSGNRVVPVSSQMISNSYYGGNRGNGVQRITSSGSGSGSVQLGSSSHTRAMEHTSSTLGISNTLKPKNIQPVISLVPLSPRGHITSDNAAFVNASITTTCVKEDRIAQNVLEKDSVMLVKIIGKDEDQVIDASSLGNSI